MIATETMQDTCRQRVRARPNPCEADLDYLTPTKPYEIDQDGHASRRSQFSILETASETVDTNREQQCSTGDLTLPEKNPVSLSPKTAQTDSGAIVRKLVLVIVLQLTMVGIEAVGYYYSNSVSIFSNLFDLLSGVLSLALALASVTLAEKRPSSEHTFGYNTYEVVSAFLITMLIITINIFVIVMATTRLWDPEEVEGDVMLYVAFFGLIIGLMSIQILLSGGASNPEQARSNHHDFEIGYSPDCEEQTSLLAATKLSNQETTTAQAGASTASANQPSLVIQSAYLQSLNSLLDAVSIIISGGLIQMWPRMLFIDPLLTIIFTSISTFAAKDTFIECASILLKQTPTTVDVDEIEKQLGSIKGVQMVRNVRIWPLDNEKIAFCCHLTLSKGMDDEDSQRVLDDADRLLINNFGLNYTNSIQVEFSPEKIDYLQADSNNQDNNQDSDPATEASD